MTFSIFTAYPRGYCAGVHRAVGMLMDIINSYPPPIYVNHEIIHNTFVVRMFERKGVIFESDVEKIPHGSLVVVSAHGTGPSYFTKLREKNMRWIDATCPLVEKVHREARDFITKGYHILYIGKRGHQEAVGVMDEGEKHFTLIENEEDVERLLYIVKGGYTRSGESEGRGKTVDMGVWGEDTVGTVMKNSTTISEASTEGVGLPTNSFGTFRNKSTEIKIEGVSRDIEKSKLALLTQTTLSVDDTSKLIEKIQDTFPDIILPKAGDICYATTNRQKAVKVLTEKVEVVLVVGSKNSSNSSKLRHVAEKLGKRAYLIDDKDDIDSSWFEGIDSVGVTSGASGPEELVEGVVAHLISLGGIFSEELRVVEEKVEFPYILTLKS